MSVGEKVNQTETTSTKMIDLSQAVKGNKHGF